MLSLINKKELIIVKSNKKFLRKASLITVIKSLIIFNNI